MGKKAKEYEKDVKQAETLDSKEARQNIFRIAKQKKEKKQTKKKDRI